MSPTIGAMVYELAAGLHPGRTVLARYGVSTEAFKQLLAQPEFAEMLRQAKRDFASLPNTADRVRLKAQLLTELGLEELWEIIRQPSQPAAARVSAYNALKSLTGLDRPEEAQPMQKFSLKIVLPPLASAPGEQSIVISAEPETEPVSAPGSLTERQTNVGTDLP